MFRLKRVHQIEMQRICTTARKDEEREKRIKNLEEQIKRLEE